MGSLLQPKEELALTKLLQDNLDLFAWKPSYMSGIDSSVVCHHLAVKPVVQRKHKLGEERRKVLDEEVQKLKDARFINEIKYLTWLANTVLVNKALWKWRICVNYRDLNMACLKYPYPLPHIDYLIDNASGFKNLNFMDAYSWSKSLKKIMPRCNRNVARWSAEGEKKNINVFSEQICSKF